jgi:A/G-specific adenine glycosylase
VSPKSRPAACGGPYMNRGSLVRAAVGWYRKNRRCLPWRHARDPYSIWISEIMLQQTQVSTVIPYYERFLLRFPDPATLAAADEEEVYRYWAGLGYYRRARQLHAAAKRITEQHSGRFPDRLEDLLALPGIGRYTAQAILSFAFDQRLGIVEANTQRLYARLMHWDRPLASTASQKALWEFAEAIVPAQLCGEFNQAMMEIGSQICTPKTPDCHHCPLLRFCPTGERGETDRIPAPKAKKVYADLTEAVVLVRNTSAQWLVRRCGESERWAGLYDFPRFDVTGNKRPAGVATKLEHAMLEKFDLDVAIFDSQYSLRHAVTRYRIRLHCFLGELRTEPLAASGNLIEPGSPRWLAFEDLQALAWNASGKRVLKWLGESLPQVSKNHQSIRPAPSSTETRRPLARRN